MIYLMRDLPPADLLISRLPPERKEKALRLPPNGRAASAAAYLLFRYAAKREWGLPVDADLPLVYSEHGKPSAPLLPGRFWNLTHTDHAVACVLSDRPCGIDLQVHTKLTAALLRRACTPAEYEIAKENRDTFFRFWCCKESYGKCKDIPVIHTFGMDASPAAGENRLSLWGMPFALWEWDGYTLSVCGGEEKLLIVEPEKIC